MRIWKKMSSSSDRIPRRILLGVTGGIAAYKSAYLVRSFIKEGWEVKVIMSKAAKNFVGPLTFSTLSKNPVHSENFDSKTGEWTNHVELGSWADLYLIAPATANTIAKAVQGIADNLLLTVYLSAKCKTLWAPAMDLDMFNHPATQANLETLKQRGNRIIDPETGELASGLIGPGRMAEPDSILDVVKAIFHKEKPESKKKGQGKKILVTAGPTYEAIDPVRFIGNRSSGKMGFAIAEALAAEGFMVDLISGPTNLRADNEAINLSLVESAEEMHTKASKSFKSSQGAILAAAVADYKPAKYFDQKQKKINGKPLELNLVETRDIAKSLNEIRNKGQFIVGFALETENETENAIKKLDRKGFDMIVLNSLNDPGAGFQLDTNKVTLIFPGEKASIDIPLKSKEEVAVDIVEQVKKLT
jgi:phosphopantothenoylcysteine decarboxylase / phosphopantothenate---cysteine ligase